VRLEGLGKLKNFNDLIGTRARDLPDVNIVPQPTTLPRAKLLYARVTKQNFALTSASSSDVNWAMKPRRMREKDMINIF
jgi:hypothetical protein